MGERVQDGSATADTEFTEINLNLSPQRTPRTPRSAGEEQSFRIPDPE